MSIITEEMRYRKKMCEYAKKHGATKAARRYHTNRQFVYRQLEKYDGTVKSLALKSRKPKSHSNEHTQEEKELLYKMVKRYKRDGYAEVFVQACKREYKRSYGAMCRVIKTLIKKTPSRKRKSYTKYEGITGKTPGDKVQIDIKYVPTECLKFNTMDKKYYQITAIDEYSRKRVLSIVDEKSCYNTSNFLLTLETKMGFKIKTIQTDNGYEFVNNKEETNKKTLFERTMLKLKIKHRRIRPYSPWQNGKVERSHRIDGEFFYNRHTFTSEANMRKKISRWNSRYNNITKKVLGFRSPNQVILDYFTSVNI